VDAIDRADIYAGSILDSDARLSDDIGHGLRYPPLGPLCNAVIA